MRLTIVFAIVLSFIVGCSNSSSPEKNYKTGPWNGLFGLQKGLTKEQIGNYTSLAEIGSENQNFSPSAVIAINYAYNDNLIKVFYDNYDRCKLP